jgi:D-sedoheptulose 7-phosphate isomerase
MSKHPVLSAVQHLQELSATALRAADQLAGQIEEATAMARACLASGGTLFFCGNGGSAADAQHIATEYTIRYLRERRALRAVALTTDTSALTAAGNDYGFDQIFSRQVEALARAGDLLFVHTTSGNSPNCLLAVEAAKRLGVKTVALTAKDGGKIRALADLTLIVPTTRTDRAQELHLAIQHAICDALDAEVAGGS